MKTDKKDHKKFVHVCKPATATQIRDDLGIRGKQRMGARRAMKK